MSVAVNNFFISLVRVTGVGHFNAAKNSWLCMYYWFCLSSGQDRAVFAKGRQNAGVRAGRSPACIGLNRYRKRRRSSGQSAACYPGLYLQPDQRCGESKSRRLLSERKKIFHPVTHQRWQGERTSGPPPARRHPRCLFVNFWTARRSDGAALPLRPAARAENLAVDR